MLNLSKNIMVICRTVKNYCRNLTLGGSSIQEEKRKLDGISRRDKRHILCTFYHKPKKEIALQIYETFVRKMQCVAFLFLKHQEFAMHCN